MSRAVQVSPRSKLMVPPQVPLLERALQADPQFAEAHRRLAEALLQTKDIGNAVREYIRAADLTDVQTRALLALHLLRSSLARTLRAR